VAGGSYQDRRRCPNPHRAAPSIEAQGAGEIPVPSACPNEAARLESGSIVINSTRTARSAVLRRVSVASSGDTTGPRLPSIWTMSS
jgi:hypothetical protein